VPSVLIARGYSVAPWDVGPLLELPDRFEVSCLWTGPKHDPIPEQLRTVPVRALRELLPGGVLGELSTMVLDNRYLSADEAFAEADIVHSAELSFWPAADAARRRRGHRFRLALTVWETLPLLSAYRNRHARRFREQVLANTDLFLPAPERAALALELEGVPPRADRRVPSGDRYCALRCRARQAGAGGAHDRLTWTPGVGEGSPGRAASARAAAPRDRANAGG
jgi:hypothetical protein